MRLIVKAMTCINTTAELTDEPYLLFSQGSTPLGRWSAGHMRDGDTAAINRSFVYSSGRVDIRLREADRIGRDDDLGGFGVDAASPRGTFTAYLPSEIGGRDATCYSITYDVQDDHVAPRRWTLNLVRIHCNDAQERTDGVYITVDDRVVTSSMRMGTGDTVFIVLVGRTIEVGEPVKIDLWEADRYNSDHLGVFWLHPNALGDDDLGRDLEHRFDADAGIVGDASYTLTYRVTPIT
ncbi:MAG: hypothetical protein OEL83_05995 [Desulforhopalus sp.]|nr:hypothetical protein [Desulforhopalus sp.]